MKACCELGKYWDLMTLVELLACQHDHCKGPLELEDYLLETCGTFCVKDCTTSEELCKLLETKGEDDGN